MAAQKPTLPKGTRDFGPADVQKRKYILNTIETVFKKYGFMPLETPTMENLSTLEGKYGEEGDKLLFRVLDSGSYFDTFKRKVDEKYTITVQNFLIDYFGRLIDQVISEQIGNNNVKLNELFVRSTKHPDFTQSFGNTDGENIGKTLRGQKVKILGEITKMINYSGLSTESTSSEIEFQKKNFRDNIINDLISLILSNNRKINNKISKFSSKEINKFISEKGLRYDLTVPFARYVVMHRNEITFPFKRYQMQPVWRADRPQKGRYREFWQCDADVVGSDSLLNELDLIQIYDEAFTQLGIKNYEIKINNRKVLAGIAEVVKSIDVMNNIAVAIDKLDKIGEEGVRKELVEQGFSESELNTLFDIITIKGENKEILNQLKGKLQSSQEGLKGIEELAFILASNPNPNINLTLDFSLARGLSYYTGCIFEVVSNDGTLKSSIGGGGRYDNLTGIFGLPNVSGVGISFGLDRIYDVMEELKLFPEQLRATSTQVLFCHFDEATQLYCLPALKALRDAGIAAEVFADNKKLGKQLDYANALQIPFAAIAGETEMQQQVFTVKNLITGEQQTCTTQALISLVGQ